MLSCISSNAIPHKYLHEEICWGHYYTLLFSRVVLLNCFTKSSKFGEGFIMITSNSDHHLPRSFYCVDVTLRCAR